jgi:hypothetical protein
MAKELQKRGRSIVATVTSPFVGAVRGLDVALAAGGIRNARSAVEDRLKNQVEDLSHQRGLLLAIDLDLHADLVEDPVALALALDQLRLRAHA